MSLLLLAAAAASPLVQEAQTFLANDTVNPSVVQFRDVRLVGDTVCGEINRPTREGGFGGFQQFAFLRRDTWVRGGLTDYVLSEKGQLEWREHLYRDLLHGNNELVAGPALQAADARRDALLAPCKV